MTRIESETIIPAGTAEVWRALLDHARWATWSGPADSTGPAAGADQGENQVVQAEAPDGDAPDVRRRVTLQSLEPLGDPAGEPGDRVGALRCGAATIVVPLLGARTVRWVEQVTDVAAPWTLEVEALQRRPLDHWRLRLWLMDQADGGTRVRCRLSYVPASLGAKLADALFLRRGIERQVEASLHGLARSFETVEEGVSRRESPPDAEPAEPAVAGSLVAA